MQKVSVKSYVVNQKTIEVKFQHKVLSIDCTPYADPKDLSVIYQACKSLLHQFKKDYHALYNQNLNISNHSFIAEIWGHLVAYKISLWAKKTFKFSLLQKLAKFAAHRSGVIDCGEASVDTNRWVWDIVGFIFFRKYR